MMKIIKCIIKKSPIYLKNLFKRSPIYYTFIKWLENHESKKEYLEWQRNGKILPPPHLVKQKTIKDFAKIHNCRVFVETGTYSGQMVEAMRTEFDEIFSIELSYELFLKATIRFRNFKKIKIIHGNSGSELTNVLEKINQPSIFWLDGHYSGGKTAKADKSTPIIEELSCILGAPDYGHVIIIDDARLFGSDPDYPSIGELKKYIFSFRPNLDFIIENDSIRIKPVVKKQNYCLVDNGIQNKANAI